MKIGYLLESGVPDIWSPTLDGPANHVREVVTGLRHLGHEVRLVVRHKNATLVSDDWGSYRTARGVSQLGPPLWERVARRIQAELAIPYFAHFDHRRFADSCVHELSGCDLLYERFGWMGLGGSRASRLLDVPHILEVNGDLRLELDWHDMAPSRGQDFVSQRLMAQVARRADAAIASGPTWRDQHVRRWGVLPDSVSVIHNGSAVVEAVRRQDLRCFAHPTPDREPLRLMFAGACTPWSGLPVILRAAGIALTENVDLHLIVAGDCGDHAAVSQLARETGLGERLIILGQLPMRALATRLASADIGLTGYWYQGQPGEYNGLKILDYKAAGLATIATGIDRQPELIQHGHTGLIVAPGDPAALARAIRLLDGDRGLLRRLGRAARLEAERRHRWRHTIEALNVTLTAVRDARHSRKHSSAASALPMRTI